MCHHWKAPQKDRVITRILTQKYRMDPLYIESSIVYKDSHADYETFLKLANAVYVYQRNLQHLMIKMYKAKDSLNPSFIREFFKLRGLQFNLTIKNTFNIPKIRTTSYGIDTVEYLGQKPWLMLPPNVRESASLIACKKD